MSEYFNLIFLKEHANIGGRKIIITEHRDYEKALKQFNVDGECTGVWRDITLFERFEMVLPGGKRCTRYTPIDTKYF